MRERRRARSLVGWLGSLVVLVGTGAPASAQAADPADLGIYGGDLRFEAGADGVIGIEGDRRYADTLELRVRDGGDDVVLVNELSMGAYLEGLAEVPARWPEEALKAQAVAARTYAWYSIELGTFARRGLGYDICATVACQVFHGRDIVEGPSGDRWAGAVEATAGEVLTTGGEPILARFFSTSGGRTQDNEEVFPREGPRPYLQGVDDPHDAVSPLHRWTARFTRAEFDAILARGETLGAAVPVASAGVRAVEDGEDLVVVEGRDGDRAEVGVSAFRFFVSDVAPEVAPDRFPGPRADGTGRLPATLPSSRFELEVTDAEVVVSGRGYGHGVGMSQYGALGQAQAGIGYEDILAHYYAGIRPTPSPGTPDRVRVGLDDDVREPLVVRGDGPFRVVASGQVVTERGLGTWRIVPRDDGTMRLVAPPGYGAPLVVAPTEVSRDAPTPVEVVTVATVVNKTSELALEVDDAAGTAVLRQPLGVVDAGRHIATWSLDDAAGDAVPAGEYRVRLVATDEDAASAGVPVDVTVRAPSTPADAAPTLLSDRAPLAAGPGPGALGVAAVLGVLAGAAAGALVSRRRR